MNHTLTNGLELLMFLSQTYRPYGVSELAEAMLLPKSHIHRLLQTLVENQYVVKDSKRRYSIGVGALRLGHSLLRNIPIRRLSVPVMQRLVKALHHPMTLALPFGQEGISVAFITGDGNVRGAMETIGAVLNPYSSASGLLFTAYKPEKERDALVSEMVFSDDSPSDFNTASAYTQALVQTVERGYAINTRDGGDRIVSVALPLRDTDGTIIAALGASSQDNPIDSESLPHLIEALTLAVSEIQTLLKESNHDDTRCQ